MDGERELRAALVHAEALHGPDSIQTGRLLHDLATVLAAPPEATASRGAIGPRLLEADALYERALAIKQGVLGQYDPEVAITLHNWALLCEAVGATDRAHDLWAAAERAVAGAHFEPDEGDDTRGDSS